MTTVTGKGGRYQYYGCSNRARAGASVCKGRRIARSKLDNIVLDAIEQRLLVPERLRDLLSGWLDLTSEAVEARREKLRQQIGRAHVCTPVTNAHLVCRLLLENT